jgi:hypothetical protein
MVAVLLALAVAAPAAELKELRGLSELRDAFNGDQGTPRVVLLMSPT